MGLALWYFLRRRPGEVQSLSRAAVDAFIFHEGQLPVGDDGLVRIFDLVVRLENRRAIEVVSIGAHQYGALPDGTLDREHLGEVKEAIAEAVFGRVLRDDPVPGVIDAGHHFAQRRLDHLSTWQPSTAEFAVLRELVNKKAHQVIM